MNSPFVYGKIAAGSTFTDREEETASLCRDFLNLTNTILISPRRWGKSSLVKKAGNAAESADNRLKVCYIDIFNTRDENEFYQKLAAEVLRVTSSRIDELFETAKKFAASLVPTIKAGDPVNSFTLRFELKEIHKNSDEILDLAEKIACEKNIRLVICIDEFQRLGTFAETDALQAKLRSHWQQHQHVAYCLYGSKRHMMIDIFTNRDKPFFNFGKTIFLNKISREIWPAFIEGKFRETGKEINRDQCMRIIDLVDNNPYYIQQLSEEVWNRTQTVCENSFIENAFMSIVQSQSSLNQAFTNMLSISQQNLLNAIVNGEKELSSYRVMETYDLKNSLTVARAKKALAELDIIDSFGKEITMEDPLYAWWLKHIWFNA